MEIKSLLKLEKIKAGNLKKKKSRFIFEKINIYFILINIIMLSLELCPYNIPQKLLILIFKLYINIFQY